MKKQTILTGTALLASCLMLTNVSAEDKIKAESLREYMAVKHSNIPAFFGILAETEDKTVFFTKDTNVMAGYGDQADRSMKRVIEGVVEYCDNIGGKSVFGNEMISYLEIFDDGGNNEAPLNNLMGSFFTKLVQSDAVARAKEQGRLEDNGYDFYKCQSGKDGFSIGAVTDRFGISYGNSFKGQGTREAFNRFYYVKHDKSQQLGWKKTWDMKLKDTDDELLPDKGITNYAFIDFSLTHMLCNKKGGTAYISDLTTGNKRMKFNDYIALHMEKASSIFKKSKEPRFTGGYAYDFPYSIIPGFIQEKAYMWCDGVASETYKIERNMDKTIRTDESIESFMTRNNISNSVAQTVTYFSPGADKMKKEESAKKEAIVTATSKLATNAIQYKQDMTKAETFVTHSASYNGIIDSCSYVSVSTTENGMRSRGEIVNFKKCGESVLENIGKSAIADMEYAEKQMTLQQESLVLNCSVNGQAMVILDDRGTIAKCTQNSDTKRMKILVLDKDNKMLYKITK